MYEDLGGVVARTLGTVIERGGMSVAEHRHSPERFGDAAVVLESPRALRLRVVRERGQLFLDLGSRADPGEWLDGRFVLEHVAGPGSREIYDPGGGISLEGAAELLAAHLPRIEEAFAPAAYAHTRSAVRALHDAWMYRTLGRPPAPG